MMDIQRKLVQDRSDDVESFTEILAIYDAALFCHGRDEEEVSDHVEEHKRGKADQRDQLVRGKHHLARYMVELATTSRECFHYSIRYYPSWKGQLAIAHAHRNLVSPEIFMLIINVYHWPTGSLLILISS